MKILSLLSENVKRLTALEIKPDSNVVMITGKNGAGKTSCLDAIWLALDYANAKKDNPNPIHGNESTARIRLDLGEFIVTRTFARKEEGGYTTKLKVERAGGGTMDEPQTIINSFLGALAFDPLEFTHLKAAEQFSMLGKLFAPDIDFKAVKELYDADYKRRTELNAAAKQARAAADAITVPEGLPEEAPDVSALTLKLQGAGEHNADIDRRIHKRAEVQRMADQLREEGNALAEREQELLAQAAKCREESQKKLEESAAQMRRLASAPALPQKIDTAELVAQINAARVIEQHLTRLAERNRHETQAEQLETSSKNLTAIMEARNAGVQQKIGAIQMPVPGLSFGNDMVLLDGQPFEQGSDAQRLMTSVAIGMASNPQLRVMRIRRGSDLDSSSLALLAKVCEEKDYQLWIEKVDESGSVGFVIEDGHLKDAPAAEAPAPAAETSKPARAPKASKAATPAPSAPPPPATVPQTADMLEGDDL